MEVVFTKIALVVLAALPLLVLPIIGVWLLKTGIWPRRRGVTPYCSGCGYNLTGLAGERCPECGRDLASGIVYGERRRSPGRIVGGAVCLLPLIPIGAIIAANVDWYRLAPTFLLISNLQSKTPNRAWNELIRRIQAGELTASQRSSLINVGLKKQVSVRASAVDDELVNQLGRWAAAGLMPDAQAKTFYDQMVTFSVRARPRVIKGDYAPLEIACKGRGPSNLTVRVGDFEVLLDGKSVPGTGGSGSGTFSGRGAGHSRVIYWKCDALGQHEVEVRTSLTVRGPSTSAVLHQSRPSLNTRFEVVPPASEYAIRLKADVALTEAIRQSIRPRDFEFGHYSKEDLSGMYEAQRVPCSVAFDAFARVHGKEQRIGHLHLLAGQSTSWSISSTLKVPPFTKLDLIFRSSEKVARETVDLQEIWAGELVYPDVPVKLGPFAMTQQSEN